MPHATNYFSPFALSLEEQDLLKQVAEQREATSMTPTEQAIARGMESRQAFIDALRKSEEARALAIREEEEQKKLAREKELQAAPTAQSLAYMEAEKIKAKSALAVPALQSAGNEPPLGGKGGTFQERLAAAKEFADKFVAEMYGEPTETAAPQTRVVPKVVNGKTVYVNEPIVEPPPPPPPGGDLSDIDKRIAGVATKKVKSAEEKGRAAFFADVERELDRSKLDVDEALYNISKKEIWEKLSAKERNEVLQFLEKTRQEKLAKQKQVNKQFAFEEYYRAGGR